MNLSPKDSSTLFLKYIGENIWSQPVYRDQHNRLWADIELGDFEEPSLYSLIDNDCDGEPFYPIKQKYIIESKGEFISKEKKFQYQMLDRLRSDCDYYLGFGNRNPNILYEKDVRRQIKAIKDLWNGFSEDEKPEWLTMEQIVQYEKEMMK